MTSLANYSDVLGQVTSYLKARREAAMRVGVPSWNIILDPGIGFAKNTQHNLELLRGCLTMVRRLHPSPLLVGASRKRFIGEILSEPEPKNRIFGNAATTAAAIVGLADVVRVHDVHEMAQTAKVCD